VGQLTGQSANYSYDGRQTAACGRSRSIIGKRSFLTLLQW
jgi:hypothetical protein